MNLKATFFKDSDLESDLLTKELLEHPERAKSLSTERLIMAINKLNKADTKDMSENSLDHLANFLIARSFEEKNFSLFNAGIRVFKIAIAQGHENAIEGYTKLIKILGFENFVRGSENNKEALLNLNLQERHFEAGVSQLLKTAEGKEEQPSKLV